MSTFMIRLGCVLALAGVFLLFSVADLLPVELWAWLHGTPAGGQYYRVVAAKGYSFIEFIFLGAGIALVVAGWTLRRRQNAGT
jgi:predicted Kef-type K+ transport protein